jgi:hypothetical protein
MVLQQLQAAHGGLGRRLLLLLLLWIAALFFSRGIGVLRWRREDDAKHVSGGKTHLGAKAHVSHHHPPLQSFIC